jgi:transcriptional antiterminator RfaH
MLKWCAVHTQPKNEAKALANLRQQGFNVYFPCFKKVITHARKTSQIVAPLFPRYLFVEIDMEKDSWYRINHSRGVSTIVMHGASPATVENKIIEQLKASENENGMVTLSSLILFEKNQTLKVIEGSFAGHTAYFDKMLDKDRICLLLNLLGRSIKVALPSYAVSTS